MQTMFERKALSARLSSQVVSSQVSVEPAAITKAKKYIAKHHNQDISLEDVAKEVFMSKYSLCKMFRNTTGIYFTDYVAALRIERAKHLLLRPNLPISQIAFEVGFQSPSNFNRVFKRILGQSPTEYRMNSIGD